MYRLRQRISFGYVPGPMTSTALHFAMLSHPGRVRKGNEDYCAARPELGAFVVCDGMGGAAAGEVASAQATEVFLKALEVPADQPPRTPTPDVRMREAVEAANSSVYSLSRSSPEMHGMGTTLVALLFEPEHEGVPGALTVAHVGDSRCYLFRDGVLRQLTADHSLVEEQVRAGEITAEEAEYHPMRNIITRAIGSLPFVDPEIQNLDPVSGDLYLLASDGLTRELSDLDIARTFRRAFRKRSRILDLTSLSKTLVDQANDAGGTDNITVLVLQIP